MVNHPNRAKVKVLDDRLAAIMAMHIGEGGHKSLDEGLCIMEAVAYVAGENWTDTPKCACPVISTFLRSWNDSLPSDEDRDRLLKPLIPKLVGTKADEALERRRAVMSADWYVRVQTPAWLRLAGLTKQADDLASLPEITDFLQCPSLMPILNAVRLDAEAARSAARSAAWSAARSAAESAAWSAAESAARLAAESAAWSAAESAAWSAAESAAESAARSAARSAAWSAAESAAESAAWSAAESAAWSAARSAAWSAAESAIQPTVAALQASAVELIERMIAA